MNYTTDIIYDKYFDRTVETAFTDNYNIQVKNISINTVHKICFIMTQSSMDGGGVKFSVKNVVEILHNVRW